MRRKNKTESCSSVRFAGTENYYTGRNTMERKLPIGIQGFEKLREEHFLYVDKTDYIYELAHVNVPYFLARPRRFGKSLLLSALKAYWEGKKALFSGLKIEKLEENNADAWKTYPVFYFDFNGVNYQQQGALEEAINILLKRWESSYACGKQGETLSERFQNILITAREMRTSASWVEKMPGIAF